MLCFPNEIHKKEKQPGEIFFITSLILSQGGIIKLGRGPQENFPFSLSTILATTGDDYGNVTWGSFL